MLIVVRMQGYTIDSNNYCGGSLITNNAILTAAHCNVGYVERKIDLQSLKKCN